MSSEIQLSNTIAELTLLAKEGKITAEDFAKLEELLASSEQARELYLDIISVQTGLNYADILQDLNSDKEQSFSCDTLELLASYEKLAPVIENKPASKAVEKVETISIARKPSNHKISNKVFLTSLISLAAFCAIFISIFQIDPELYEGNITISDCWQDKCIQNQKLAKGEIIDYSGHLYRIDSGIIKLNYQNGTETIIEGPAEFSCPNAKLIYLASGYLHANVSPQAYGFTVKTNSSSIVDLGTEFGVYVDSSNNTSTTTFNGKTRLKPNSWFASSKEITSGHAIRINTQGSFKAINPQDNTFVRRFDSKDNFLWRGGEVYLNLADIVGGGNGLNTGQIEQGINLANGSSESLFDGLNHSGSNKYIATSQLPFIDGVFVPDNNNGKLQVTSTGEIFDKCPDTNMLYFDEIRNGGIAKSIDNTSYTMKYQGKRVGTSELPLLFMHANAGITFDLKAIRNAMPEFSIDSFISKFIVLDLPEGKEFHYGISVFILVDGQLVDYRENMNRESEALDLNIGFDSDDRFLTFIVTDGEKDIALDWTGFLDPKLVLNHIEK